MLVRGLFVGGKDRRDIAFLWGLGFYLRGWGMGKCLYVVSLVC